MRALALVVVLTSAANARAQGGAPLTIPVEYTLGTALGVSVFASSLVTGFGSLHDAQRGKWSWAVWASAGLGLANLGLGAGMLVLGATRRGEESWFYPAALALLHGGFNVAMAVLGFAGTGDRPPAAAPVVLHGRSPVGGHRWSGLGVEVAL